MYNTAANVAYGFIKTLYVELFYYTKLGILVCILTEIIERKRVAVLYQI